MPQEQWEKASVHPFSFLLEFQMLSDSARETLSSRNSMWERLSGEQQHSHLCHCALAARLSQGSAPSPAPASTPAGM